MAIKPSNVTVTLHDGLAVPKVIDFGIAKATHPWERRHPCRQVSRFLRPRPWPARMLALPEVA